MLGRHSEFQLDSCTNELPAVNRATRRQNPLQGARGRAEPTLAHASSAPQRSRTEIQVPKTKGALPLSRSPARLYPIPPATQRSYSLVFVCVNTLNTLFECRAPDTEPNARQSPVQSIAQRQCIAFRSYYKVLCDYHRAEVSNLTQYFILQNSRISY